MTTDQVRLRAMIAPTPNYPTPWRVAETRQDHVVVTCATGCYTANCPTDDAAEIIVAAVNAFANMVPVPPVGRLLCPVCGVGAIWSSDTGTACTDPSPAAGGGPGCGAQWDAVGARIE
jgi:hypothetical protein